MPAVAGDLRFETLRTWEGSQSRAFEELTFQLLKSDVPDGAKAIRTANPDGGVEWYATLDNGSELGWQAKHIQHFNTLLGAMTSTVKRVVVDRPQLTRLTFVISSNLTTGTRAGTALSQRQRYEAKIADWKANIDGAANIEFELIQGSDVLARLAEPQHKGRAWFWWRLPVLGEQWLVDRLTEQASAAGERYRPDLQVDVPIESDLQALGFDNEITREFDRLRKAVISSGRSGRVRPSGPDELVTLHDAMNSRLTKLLEECASPVLLASSPSSTLQPIREAANSLLETISDAQMMEHRLQAEWRGLPSDEPEKEAKKPPQEAIGYSAQDVERTVSALSSWLGSGPGKLLSTQLYFLVGPAGIGKTHLLLDGVRRALANRRPAVVLFGARFGTGNLWGSICDQLGIESIGADDLLGAMDSAGEASSLSGQRFVLCIDALNDTIPPEFWRSHLPALRAAVERFPHVSLAVACRDTYLGLVAEDEELRHYVQRTHPGFGGREVEATHKYFAHYGLEAPRIPLLVPEFTSPLFLRLFCETLRESGFASGAVGHVGRIQTFERFLETKILRVARKLNPSAGSNYELDLAKRRVRAAVDGLLDEFTRVGREATSLARAEELTTAALGGSTSDAAVVLGALQDEGVLTRELLYLGGGTTEDGLRIVFQAFADYLLLDRRLDQSSEPLTDPDFQEWLSNQASWGIVETAAVLLPERFAIELPDLLGLDSKSLNQPERDDDEAWQRHGRASNVYRSVIETLPYRDSSAVTDRTIELLNHGIHLFDMTELFRTMIQLAPQPDNKLNGEALHNYLLQYQMPTRDRAFGIAMYHEIFDESSPVSTLARWASGGPYPDYDPLVVELASIPLVWLLSTSNRFMRDWITKSLVQLLRGHLDVMLSLLERFWTIDDPYVVQRITVIAYGALIRSTESTDADRKRLALQIRRLVFTRPVPADELLLDAAKGIVELGVQRGWLPKAALKEIKRPYGLSVLSPAPSDESIETKYGYKKDEPDDKSYSTVSFSVLGMGDFGRYVVEAGLRHFSSIPLIKPYPEEPPPPERRLVKSRWRAFEKSLEKSELANLRQLDVEVADNPDDRVELISSFLNDLTAEQKVLFFGSWQYPKTRRRRDDEYPARRAQRWIFRRTLGLGWSPKLFGREDRYRGFDRSGRQGHKAERWGKKYQWMAYHEALARVADNYHWLRRYDNHTTYEGLHQIIGDREIDPTVPPISYEEFVADQKNPDVRAWSESPVRFGQWPPAGIDFTRYANDIDRFLLDQTTEPTLDKICVLEDEQGTQWVVLDGFIRQGDPTAEKYWLGLQQILAINSSFVPRIQGDSLLSALAAIRHHDHWGLVDDHGHVDCCYFGEIGLTSHNCDNSHGELKEIEFNGETWSVAQSVETYTWEGGLYDCSIEESVRATLPSTFVRIRSELSQDDRGPSWVDSAGDVIFSLVGGSSDGSSVFIVRGDWLKNFLFDYDLDLVVSSWQERHCSTGDRSDLPLEQVVAAAKIDSDLTISLSETIRERR
jgi:hypothetical protein